MRAYLVPHVPFMMPQLGGEEISQYIEEILDIFNLIRQEIIKNPPEAILICSPHYQDQVFQVGLAENYHGSFANFQRPDLKDTRKGHMELSKHIQRHAEDIGFLAPNKQVDTSTIDYGSIVPLTIIDPDAKIPIIPISISMGSKKEHFLWGKNLQESVSQYSDNVVFIASTELTQDFQENIRAYPGNSDLDIEYLQLVRNGDIDAIESFDTAYFQNVENNLLPTAILAGFGSNLKHSEILLYTGFVGCGCAFLEFKD